ncbi:MAG TPA: phytoene/squalene synthase family protein [Gemmatimonadaceae bacterium]|nr:phytoene/squalene synthase family protein [Gemmatimonadaceae bacterium]
MSDRDAQVCQRIVREHARTFHLASAFLPRHKRRAAFALYAFCRVADDIVDRAERARCDGTAADPEVVAALAAHDEKLQSALAGTPTDPVFRELDRVMREFGVPASVLRELMDGVAMDLAPVKYETWADLAGYCEGVASSVGEMCTYVFGVQGDDEVRAVALRYARTLGLAMQLTNILRDVGEDARRGRCYLPVQDLAAAGLTTGDILGGSIKATDARWQRFMQQQIARARSLYDAAMPGIELLSSDAQRCAWACAVGYSGILGALERIGCDSLTQRARLGTVERASVLMKVWQTRPVTQAVRLHPSVAGPQLAWHPPESTPADELVRIA